MDYFKIILFLYTVVSSVYTRAADRRMFFEPKVNTKNYLGLPQSFTYPTVAEVLDPNNYGLERLVLFIYRDVNTNMFKVYTPNAKKQSQIPDLPYENEDSLATTQTLAIDIFDKNPHKTLLKKRHPKFKDKHAIGLEIGHIEEEVTHGSSSNSYQENVVGEIGSNIHSIYMAGGISTPTPVEPSQFNDIQNKVWVYDAEGNTWHEKGKLCEVNDKEFPEMHYHNIYGKPKDNKMSWHMNNQELEEYYDSIYSRPKHNKKQLEMNSKEIEDFYHLENVEPNGNNEHSVYDVGIAEGDQNVVTQPEKNTHPLTFDVWFMQQIKGVQSMNLFSDITPADSLNIKNSIRKKLEKRNIYVSTNGILVDMYGANIDIANLELRPIILGSLLPMKKGYGHDKSVPSKVESHLEAILITMVHPPKVLGMIPLRNSILSQPSSWTDTTRPSEKIKDPIAVTTDLSQNKLTMNSDSHKMSTTYEDLPPMIHLGDVTSNKAVDMPVIKHQYVLTKPSKKRSNTRSDSKKWKLKVRNSDNIMKKINQVLSSNKGERVDIGVLDNEFEVPEHIEEKPDFRIIGGNAATSSGAPVSNKGRSGSDV